MKAILIAFSCIVAVATGAVIINAGENYHHRNLGESRCTWGPSYWCQNLTNSAECKTTHHCIKHVWENMSVQEDNDSVCTICKDMVKEARDQLESNQTQNDLKAVFEGSCKLMIVKPIVKGCIKLVDEFIPELVETLASQMDPSVVCSVSGLCNSKKIDNLISEYQKKDTEFKKLDKTNKVKDISLKNDEVEPDECSKCYTVTKIMKNKLDKQTPTDIIKNLLHFCGKLGSYSDSCVYLITKYSEPLYNLKYEFTPTNICHLSGQCQHKFHQHENEDEVDTSLNVDIRPMSSVGLVDVDDDLPCKLCAQLVGHLRDVLIANSTEAEFKLVMEGICTQSGQFAPECKAIVDQYYSEIYEFLVKKLDGNMFCQMAGMCPAPDREELDIPFMPLLPSSTFKEASKFMEKIFDQEEKRTMSEADEMQLPIERFQGFGSLLNFPNMNVEGQKTCELCKWILHFIQEYVTEEKTMTEIREEMDKACAKVPGKFDEMCEDFVEKYGNAMVAILVQEMDPAEVCPFLNICPTKEMLIMWETIPKDFMIKTTDKENVKEKSTCPLCLFAVQQLYNAIQNEKTEDKIKEELDKLCSHLSNSLKQECDDFVNAYTNELIRMLLDDMKPDEICQEFKLCDKPKSLAPPTSLLFPTDNDGQIMTNEIPDYNVEPVKSPLGDVECEICEALMGKLESMIQDKQTEAEIKDIVHKVCPYVVGYQKECFKFVYQYGDLVIDMLVDQVKPSLICTAMKMCTAQQERFKVSLNECDLCQTVTSTIDLRSANPNIAQDVEKIVEVVCGFVPKKIHKKCERMMDSYKPSIVNIIKEDQNANKVCEKIAFCSPTDMYVLFSKTYRKHFNQ